AAAGITQGFLAYAFTHKAYPVQKGDWCLVQAAASGIGRLICQMIKKRQGKVIAVTSKDHKAKSLEAFKVDEILISTKDDIVQEVKKITNGQGVAAIYDGVGQATFEQNLNCIALGGYFIIYGQSSGYIPPIDIM